MLILLFRTTFLIFVANIQIKTDTTNINGTKRKHIDEIRLHSPPYREGKGGGPFLCLCVNNNSKGGPMGSAFIVFVGMVL